MTFADFIIPFLTYMALLPAMIFCYAPVQNHLRFARSHIFAALLVMCVAFSAVSALMQLYVVGGFSVAYLIGLMLVFFTYHKTLTLHVSQSATIFLMACSFSTFLSNFSIIYDAFLHPDGTISDFSPQACIFLLVSFFAFYALAFFPMAKYGSYILDHLPQSRVWRATALVAGVFFLFNLCMIVKRYSTLHTNKVGTAYITVMIMMFVLLILLCVILYYIVNALIRKAEAEDRNRIFEMQEKQYESLQRYLDADAKARHDFRQTICTLKELSSEKDLAAIDAYLSRYIETLPQKETADYCRDHALNALLNHYVRRAEQEHIRTEIKTDLPETLYIDSVDLCSVIGNILDNAIAACRDVPEDRRFIRLVVSEEQGGELYIAASNSFGGKLRQKKGRYLSTHKGGNGIGLASIAATAERYGGTADYSHDDDAFYSDVMLVNRKNAAEALAAAKQYAERR